jgi:quinol monooxygenase YgiN
VFEKVGEPNHFVWIERWKDPKSFEAYRQSERYKALLGAVQVLGNLEEAFRFEYAQPDNKRQ